MKNKQPYLPNPYEKLPSECFWKSGVVDEDPLNIKSIYTKKFKIEKDTCVASAGSCFAQHISKYLLLNGFNVVDKEKAPHGFPESLKSSYGYNMFSARFGNIYSVKQLLQLAKEVAGLLKPKGYIWMKGDKFYDAFRPSIEPNGFISKSELNKHRKFHLSKVKDMFEEMDILIFTMGLTQAWTNKDNQLVYPSAPGTIAGEFNPLKYKLVNAEYDEILNDFNEFTQILSTLRTKPEKCKFILTISPVPLTATGINEHVLLSSIYSKSVLRAVAGKLSQNHNIDYFPSYEIVNNPRLKFSPFEENLRTVKKSTVDNVMKHFFAEHKPIQEDEDNDSFKKNIEIDAQCEDALLESFKNNEVKTN